MFSNCLYGNFSTMQLIKHCLDLENQEDCGMELIDGEVVLDKNLEIEKHSKRQTVYAIGSKFDLDEPIFLINDDDLVDGMALLKYVPDD
jgi:hypothetical protein